MEVLKVSIIYSIKGINSKHLQQGSFCTEVRFESFWNSEMAYTVFGHLNLFSGNEKK